MKRWMTKRTIGISIGVLAVLILGGAWWVHTSATAYSRDAAAFKQQLHTAYTAQKTDFDQLAPTATNADAAVVMRRSEARLERALAGAPKQPVALVAVPFAASATKDEAHALRTTAEQLKTALHNTQAYVTYEAQVQTILAAINSQDNDTPAEQQALAVTWKENTTKLEKLSVPSGAEKVQQTFLKQFQETDTLLSNIVRDYQQQDFARYLENTDALDAKIAQLQHVGASFTQLARTYDQAITTAYSRLGQLVR